MTADSCVLDVGGGDSHLVDALAARGCSPEGLAAELGPAFSLRDARAHLHTTPWGSTQSLQYSWFVRAH